MVLAGQCGTPRVPIVGAEEGLLAEQVERPSPKLRALSIIISGKPDNNV